MITVHISGGEKMLKEAKKVSKKTKIIGVSVLTSLENNDLKKFYNIDNSKKLVSKMTKVALKSKIDGIVCSPKEIKIVKKISKKKLKIITPGIRLKNNNISKDDQKRIMQPKEAIKLGANYLVIGRPILNAKDPMKIINLINEEKI